MTMTTTGWFETRAYAVSPGAACSVPGCARPRCDDQHCVYCSILFGAYDELVSLDGVEEWHPHG